MVIIDVTNVRRKVLLIRDRSYADLEIGRSKSVKEFARTERSPAVAPVTYRWRFVLKLMMITIVVVVIIIIIIVIVIQRS